MDLTLFRYKKSDDFTLGVMHVDGKYQCYTLEDEIREEKVSGETCIPDGCYEVKFREVLSGLTKRYRRRFDWFKWHLELQGVPNFKYVYIHVGNTDDDTDGCILVGSLPGHESISYSVKAYKKLYTKLTKTFAAGEKVFVNVKTL